MAGDGRALDLGAALGDDLLGGQNRRLHPVPFLLLFVTEPLWLRSRRGNRPNRAAKGSGSIAREALQQLEAAGLVQTVQAKGRIVTAKGRGLMDNAAHAVRATVQKDIPALAKY